MASAWKRLRNGEIDISEALEFLVNSEGEINWSEFDLEVNRRFQGNCKNLNYPLPVVPLFLWRQCYYLGSATEIPLQNIQQYKDITNCDIKVIPISKESYKNWSAVKEYDIDSININKFTDLLTEDSKSEDFSLTSQKYFRKFSSPQDRLAFLISFALHHNASDIHLESERKHLNIRFRIDGLLHNLSRLSTNDGRSLINALKVMCNMDITDRRRPQDGSTQTTYAFDNDPVPVDLRVSTYPGVCGEKAVIRLLPQRNRFETLADLGFTQKALSIYRQWINEPHGIIIITGPTGSGKTSTLYASLREVASETKNIVTIEDPVEYTMPGITQGGVNPQAGMTFKIGLKAILRQDPDIIMVGEIRDRDTAETAIRAALTGHLVLTTVHTNDVVSVIPRLKGLGLDPDLISDSLLGIVAQRLVRKVCGECGKPYEPTESDLHFLSLTTESSNSQNWRKGVGCEKCFQSGFSGREAVVELLDIDDKVKQYIREDKVSEIHQYLHTIDFNSFHYSACEKVTTGITTVEEVQRVLSSHAMRSFSSTKLA